MRHALGWADLTGMTVGIFGAGVEGHAALERLDGLARDVVVVDDAPQPDSDLRVLATDQGGLDALARCDVVIKSPGISAYRPEIAALEAQGVPVVGGIGLTLHEVDRSRVICVTGTKGKSTTSAILGHLLTGLGKRVAVTGNIGIPPFDVSVPDDLDVLVIETSSFQALDVVDAPAVVVVTSLDTDHLDWHGSVEQYRADKLSLTALPNAGITIAQGNSPALRAHAADLGGDVRWVSALAGPWSEGLGLTGAHNLANAELAREALLALGINEAKDEELLRRAAHGFTGLPGRFSTAGSIGAVRFIDDSLATNVLPTLAALDAVRGHRVALLLGGHDRGIDYHSLITALQRRGEPTLVIGLPDSGPRLVEAIAATPTTTEVRTADSVAEATALGYAWADPDGVVLLSPAAPSFSQFTSWKERSASFRAAIDELRIHAASRADSTSTD